MAELVVHMIALNWFGFGQGRGRVGKSAGDRVAHTLALAHTRRKPSACGESGIRTRDTLLRYTHFPGVLLQPLGHLSVEWVTKVSTILLVFQCRN